MTRYLKQVLLLRTALLKTLSSEKEKQYCQLLELWLRKRCTREEFDLSVTKILSVTGLKLHTKFLSSLSKISCGLTALPLIQNKGIIRTLENVDNFMQYKFIDKTIPCAPICSARFLAFAWKSGIISVGSQVGKLLHVALINYLKNIIFTIITDKNPKKIKHNNFVYVDNKNIGKICNTNLPTGFIHKNYISTNDLIHTLQLHPSVIKTGPVKYIELIVNGSLSNDHSVANLMPLNI